MRASTSPAAAPEALPLIETKLVHTRPRQGTLGRERLLAELDRHSSEALTLVVAPVGFGKSVLVQSWCEHTDWAIAWLSLGDGDNDPARLWSYIATSVDRVRSGIGRMALHRLRVPGISVEVAVDELLNGVNTYGQPLAIVLDDLHLLNDDTCLH